ncbi:NifU family protein [Brumimicrobium glaciale]|jgi:Fe-S cluster biogenesis protein NfuA|uniref:NifU family protein n=1 Tax=Brumimicrobium glaciale TaxID=200475 RepID=A0A4Q4KGZ6_9FLAO|nr:NifU family protein [Brumimicrobium glaciale]RYM32442.1 NifU family protein [Brumimicrobium glaciale]
MSKTLEDTVNEALDQLRPFLEQDGGDMELVEITEDKVVRVRLLGACRDCSMSAMTMKAGLEEAVKRAAPEVIRVEAVDPSDTFIN